jgi:hypothetical protein
MNRISAEGPKCFEPASPKRRCRQHVAVERIKTEMAQTSNDLYSSFRTADKGGSAPNETHSKNNVTVRLVQR